MTRTADQTNDRHCRGRGEQVRPCRTESGSFVPVRRFIKRWQARSDAPRGTVRSRCAVAAPGRPQAIAEESRRLVGDRRDGLAQRGERRIRALGEQDAIKARDLHCLGDKDVLVVQFTYGTEGTEVHAQDERVRERAAGEQLTYRVAPEAEGEAPKDRGRGVRPSTLPTPSSKAARRLRPVELAPVSDTKTTSLQDRLTTYSSIARTPAALSTPT